MRVGWLLSQYTEQVERLANVSIVAEFGALGPLTQSGTLIVNNISTSCCKCYVMSFLQFTPYRCIIPPRLGPHGIVACSLVAAHLPRRWGEPDEGGHQELHHEHQVARQVRLQCFLSTNFRLLTDFRPRILSPSGFRIDSRYMETDDRGTNYVAPLVSALAISISAVVLFKKASPWIHAPWMILYLISILTLTITLCDM